MDEAKQGRVRDGGSKLTPDDMIPANLKQENPWT